MSNFGTISPSVSARITINEIIASDIVDVKSDKLTLELAAI